MIDLTLSAYNPQTALAMANSYRPTSYVKVSV